MRPSSALGHPPRRRPAHAAALASRLSRRTDRVRYDPVGRRGSGATTSASPEAATRRPTRQTADLHAEPRPPRPQQPADRAPSSTDEHGRGGRSTHDSGDPALVLAVRYAAHDTYDRVVIDLKGAMPGYNVQWVEQTPQDGSGKDFDLPGGAYLQLILTPPRPTTPRARPPGTAAPSSRPTSAT